MSETSEQTTDRPSGLRPAWNPVRRLKRWISADRRARFWRRLVWHTVAVLVFLVSFYTAVFMVHDARGALVLSLLIAAVFSTICVLVHELGHALAARAVGWRVHLIVVGPWAFAPRRRRLIRIRDRGYWQDLGGWVNATPPPGMSWTDGVIPFILGGAIGNLVLAGVSALAALAVHGTERHVFAGLMGLAAISMVFAVTNLIPLRGPGRRNDGALLIDALKREEPPRRARNIARLTGERFDGLPVAQWDPSAVNELAQDPSIDREDADSLLLSYALTVADLAGVGRILERALADNPDGDPEHRCLHAFVVAMVDRDGQRAAAILEAVPEEAARESFAFLRAEAATLHLLGRREEALAAIDRARQVAARLGVRPDEDDEALFRAITLGEDLPTLEPRGRIPGG